MKILLRLASVALASFVAVMLAAGPSQAAQYTVNYCRDAYDKPTNSADWVPYVTGEPTGDELVNQCGIGGGLYINWSGTKSRKEGVNQGFSLTALNSNTIRKATVKVDNSITNGGANVSAQGPGYGCYWFSANTCTRGIAEVSQDYAGAKTISVSLACSATSNGSCTGSASSILINARVVFDDPSAPGSVSSRRGALLRSGVRLTLGGTVAGSFVANDSGSGVMGARIVVDGSEVARSQPLCDSANFVAQRPCPRRPTVRASLDTTSLSNGEHDLAVYVMDAAGNETRVRADRVRVANPAEPNGVGAAEGAILKSWWRKGKKEKKQTDIGVRYSQSKSRILDGTLTTSAGAPIKDALVDVVATSAGSVGDYMDLASTSTDSRGRYSIKVPISWGSAELETSYNAFSDGRGYVSVKNKIRVGAATTLRYPKRTKVRKRWLLSGVLRGKTGNPGGSKVRVDAKIKRKKWVTIFTSDVNDAGAWSGTYKFPRRGKIKFRAVVQPVAAYPYVAQRSGSRTVRVR